jgi:hypothetical protein
LLGREIQGLGETQPVARGLRSRSALLPASAQAKQPRSRRDSDDPQPVVRFGGDDPRNSGAMILGDFGLPGDKIAVDDQLATRSG